MGWSQQEEELLCRLYEVNAPAGVMAGALGRSYGAIHVKACRMGLTKESRVYAPKVFEWREEDVDKLLRFWSQGRSPAQIASAIGCSISAVYRKLNRLGLGCPVGRRRPAGGDKVRSPEEMAKFRRLLELLVWCKQKTGLASKDVVNVVLGDGEKR